MLNMTDPSILIRLPLSVGRSILSNWLVIKFVGLLDNAYCSHIERSSFLELLQRTTEILDIVDQNPCRSPRMQPSFDHKLKWLVKRCVTSSSFSYYSNLALPVRLFKAFMKINATTLKHVSLRTNNKIIKFVLDTMAISLCSLEIVDIPFGTPPGNCTVDWMPALATVLRNSCASLTEIRRISPLNWKLFFPCDLQFSSLKTIRISVDSDDDLVSICRAAPNLTTIDISSARCTHIGFEAIGECCPKLHTLSISCAGNTVDLDRALEAIARKCLNLSVLQIDTCAQLTNAGIMAFSRHNIPLKGLHLTRNDTLNVTDAALEAIALSAAAAGSLEHLTLGPCAGINGTGVVAIARECRKLRCLDLNSLSTMTAENIMAMIPHLTGVIKIGLFQSPVTDEVLELIAEHMPMLEELTISCGSFTTEGLIPIALKCEKLEHLRVGPKFASAFSKLSIALWEKARPGFKISGYNHFAF